MGSLAGCQTTLNVQDLKSADCFFPDTPEIEAPQWVCGITPEGVEISATGYAKKNIAGFSIMNDMSRNDARINLGRQFEVNVKSLVKTVVTANTESGDEAVSENVKEYFEITNFKAPTSLTKVESNGRELSTKPEDISDIIKKLKSISHHDRAGFHTEHLEKGEYDHPENHIHLEKGNQLTFPEYFNAWINGRGVWPQLYTKVVVEVVGLLRLLRR